MYYASPYQVKLDSFDQLQIITDSELESVMLEQHNQIINLAFTPTNSGYQADIEQLEIDLQSELFVHLNSKIKQHVEIGLITTTTDFDQKYQSTELLGALYTPSATTFRVWSPVATEVILVIDNSKYYQLEGDGRHYQLTVDGNLEGQEYYYITCISGQYHKVIDPYALNLTLNTEAGIIVDRQKYIFDLEYNQNEKERMIIYETSVCDFTSNTELDFTSKGKYIGFNQSLKYEGYSIGIDYLKELGVSHIQLMPIYDFGSVNEQFVTDANYNWGYDPVHYNVPEGSYVVGTKFDSRILECKQMIDEIKQNGFGVIMDVVYNHVYEANSFNYNQLVPNYFFRFDEQGEYSNGSFCGNEVASERVMVRKYIIDTLQTWIQLYGIDGIRVDLMGLIDIETIKSIEVAMQAINPNFMIYGEGWNMDSMLEESQRAAQINGDKLPTVGHFNDDLRNFIKGDNSDFTKIGYIQGNEDNQSLATILSGKPLDNSKKYDNEYQLINYLSCHDDHTLYDYLKMNESDEQILTEQIIAGYELLFSARGIPFIHSGCEFKRSKNGKKNTYNSSRQLNSIKWQQIKDNQVIINNVKALIFRRTNGKYE